MRNRENIGGTGKLIERIREILSAVALIAALIYKTVFQERQSDVVFDVGGKAVIIVTLLLFLVICFIQNKKIDKG